MIFRNLDSGGDWTFGRGIGCYARDEKAIEANLKTRLLSWVGDCFFALDEGVDWRSRLDVGQSAALDQEIRAVILQSYGVVGINSVTLTNNHTTRIVTILYDIQTFFSLSFQRELAQAIGA